MNKLLEYFVYFLLFLFVFNSLLGIQCKYTINGKFVPMDEFHKQRNNNPNLPYGAEAGGFGLPMCGFYL